MFVHAIAASRRAVTMTKRAKLIVLEQYLPLEKTTVFPYFWGKSKLCAAWAHFLPLTILSRCLREVENH